MLLYCIRRVLQMVPTVIGVVLLTFILFNVVPNDLAAISLGKNVTSEMLERFDEQRGLNLPLFFGNNIKTRMYEDHNFIDGPGRWSSEKIIFNDEEKFISFKSDDVYSPLSFVSKNEYKYEWKGIFRGQGTIGGSKVSSHTWNHFTILSDSKSYDNFLGEIDFKKIQLRIKNDNPFNSLLHLPGPSIKL